MDLISTFSTVHFSSYVDEDAKTLETKFRPLDRDCEAAWLLKAVSCIDLTTLGGDDTPSNVTRLCHKAVNPISKKILGKLINAETSEGFVLTTAAVCVYPARVGDARRAIDKLNSKLPIASVAAGFPSGQFPLATRLDEVRFCVQSGATEIDIVLDRSLVLRQDWTEVYTEVAAMVAAAGQAHVKVILSVGECGSYENVYKAAMVSMMAGAHFIKTSTGKETVNATLPFGLVMCRAIRDFYTRTGKKIGLKPAGGLKTSRDAILWLALVKRELGDEWLSPSLFRIGASSLLGALEKRLETLAETKS